MSSWFRQTGRDPPRQKCGVAAEGGSVEETEGEDRRKTDQLTVDRPPTEE